MNSTTNTDARTDVIVGSFTAAVWLVAKGFMPLTATVNPLRRRIEFRFPAEAKDAWRAFFAAKNHLEQMSRQSERQAERRA